MSKNAIIPYNDALSSAPEAAAGLLSTSQGSAPTDSLMPASAANQLLSIAVNRAPTSTLTLARGGSCSPTESTDNMLDSWSKSSLTKCVAMGLVAGAGCAVTGWLIRQVANWWYKPKPPGGGGGHSASRGGINAPFSTARNWTVFHRPIIIITLNIFPRR